MLEPLRVGVIGFAHMHVNDVLGRFAKLPHVQWVACADTVPDVPETSDAAYTRAWNLRFAQDTIGIPKVYADYRELLDREALDLVLVYSENARHAEVAEAVAAKGAHVLVEKPMADTAFNALRMAQAARVAGVDLVVNWPTTWMPAMRKAEQVIVAGAIGKVYQVKYRGGHAGPLGRGVTHQGVSGDTNVITDADRGRTWWHRAGTGGGVLLDYCCYGACLSRLFIGEPATAAFALAANLGSPFAQTEDNATVLARFPSAYAICEGSWTTLDPGVTPGPIVYGEKGTLLVQRQADRQWVEIRRGQGTSPEVIEPEPLTEGRQDIAQEVVSYLSRGEPLHPTLQPEFNVEVMAILDAALRSVKSGKAEVTTDSYWCVG